jgi:hypothetical protein
MLQVARIAPLLSNGVFIISERAVDPVIEDLLAPYIAFVPWGRKEVLVDVYVVHCSTRVCVLVMSTCMHACTLVCLCSTAGLCHHSIELCVVAWRHHPRQLTVDDVLPWTGATNAARRKIVQRRSQEWMRTSYRSDTLPESQELYLRMVAMMFPQWYIDSFFAFRKAEAAWPCPQSTWPRAESRSD